MLRFKFCNHFEIEKFGKICTILYIENENIFIREVKEDLNKGKGRRKGS